FRTSNLEFAIGGEWWCAFCRSLPGVSPGYIDQSVRLAPARARHRLSAKRLFDGPHFGIPQLQFPLVRRIVRRTVSTCRDSWDHRHAAAARLWSGIADIGNAPSSFVFRAPRAGGGRVVAAAQRCGAEP